MLNVSINRLGITFNYYLFSETTNIEFTKGISFVATNIETKSIALNSDKDLIIRKQETLVNDLMIDANDIFASFSKTTRYDIRKAEEMKTTTIFFDYYEPQIIKKFERTYNKMFFEKNKKNRLNTKLIKQSLRQKKMILTYIEAPEYDDCFVIHAYFCDGVFCELEYSTSPIWNKKTKEQKDVIGRINKLLHWKDMNFFKEKKYSEYQWGGINSYTNPSGISKFKISFGGKPKEFYRFVFFKGFIAKIIKIIFKKRGRK